METPNEPAPQASDRSNVLAELEAMDSEQVSQESAPAGEEAESNEENPEANAATENEEEENSEEAPVDIDVDTRKLEALQKAEKRQKEAIAAAESELKRKMAEFEANQKDWQEKLERFTSLQEKAKYDPVAALNALGVEPDQYEDAARAFYANRPGAEEDAKTRGDAKRAFKDRQMADEIANTRKELESLRNELKQEKEALQLEAQRKAYLDSATSAVDESAPIVAKMLKNNPERARELLAETAGMLYKASGEAPEPIDVVKELEQNKRQELLELGFDPSGNPTKTEAQSPQTSAGKTLTNELGTPTKPRTTPASREELRQDVLRDMTAGNLEV